MKCHRLVMSPPPPFSRTGIMTRRPVRKTLKSAEMTTLSCTHCAVHAVHGGDNGLRLRMVHLQRGTGKVYTGLCMPGRVPGGYSRAGREVLGSPGGLFNTRQEVPRSPGGLFNTRKEVPGAGGRSLLTPGRRSQEQEGGLF